MGNNTIKLKDIGCDLSFKSHINEEIKGTFKLKEELECVDEGYIFRRTVTNCTDKDANLFGLTVTLIGLNLGGNTLDDYYYANENGRLFSTLTLPIDYDRENQDEDINAKLGVKVDSRWADPEIINAKILDSSYQPYPAILISNYEKKCGLVCGTLSQDYFYNNYQLSHDGENIVVKINSQFKDTEYRIVKPGEELEDIIFIGSTNTADDFNHLFDGYNAVLRRFLTNNVGSSEISRHTLIWDSWNDGIFRNISEEMLLNEARAIKQLMPSVEWFQVDDGYSEFCSSGLSLSAHGLGVYYEDNHGIDREKFPGGLSSYTKKVKELGLRPAIWIGAACPNDTQIVKEKDEWFLKYSFRMDWARPLDISIPEVGKFMKDSFEWFVKEGFEGVKHDFWSYTFEDSHDLLSFKEKSGYEHRAWWSKTMRNALGNDAYIGTACDLSMGNPFLGKYFNNYRFGLDVGGGVWNEVLTTFFWGACVLSTHCGDLYVPNCDSVGFLPGLNDTDYMFVVNFAIISRSFVETSGKYSAVSEDDKRLKILQNASEYLNNGEDVYYAKFNYRARGQNYPEIMYIKSHFNSPDQNENYRTVALFNPVEEEKTVECSVTDIELENAEYNIKDFWSGEEFTGNNIIASLKPHESRLFLIEKA